MPLAPGRLSTMTDCPNFSVNFCAKTRATVSGKPPAGLGTTNLMARSCPQDIMGHAPKALTAPAD